MEAKIENAKKSKMKRLGKRNFSYLLSFRTYHKKSKYWWAAIKQFIMCFYNIESGIANYKTVSCKDLVGR